MSRNGNICVPIQETPCLYAYIYIYVYRYICICYNMHAAYTHAQQPGLSKERDKRWSLCGQLEINSGKCKVPARWGADLQPGRIGVPACSAWQPLDGSSAECQVTQKPLLASEICTPEFRNPQQTTRARINPRACGRHWCFCARSPEPNVKSLPID